MQNALNFSSGCMHSPLQQNVIGFCIISASIDVSENDLTIRDISLSCNSFFLSLKYILRPGRVCTTNIFATKLASSPHNQNILAPRKILCGFEKDTEVRSASPLHRQTT